MAKGVSGIGLSAASVGVLFLWSAIKGASVTETLRELIRGEQPKGLNLFPIKPPPPADPSEMGLGDNGGPVPGQDDKSGSFASSGLDADALKAGRLVVNMFGNPYGIGGRRNEPGSDHHTGNAIDVMISPIGKSANAGQVQRGNAIAAWARANHKALNVKYVIWRQRIWNPGRSDEWRQMDNRGSLTQNHMDHVHISFL